MKKILFVCLTFTLLMISCKSNRQPIVSYDLDGGYFEEPADFSDDILPMPQKEGYIFIGWLHNNEIIESLENKEYYLKALWSENKEYNYIQDSDLFLQDEMDYYVYLMRDGCSWCEKIKEDVLRYQYKTTLNNKLKKIYVVNLQTSKYNSPILRTYEQSEDGFFINESYNWEELYIPSTPTLLEVKESNDTRKAFLVASGATVIKNNLISSAKDSNDYSSITSTYEITYDFDGGSCDSVVTKYNKWQKVLLPIPQKEGYYFSGWMENGEFVTDIQNKNYSLTAKWTEGSNIEEIKEEDIFKQDNPYYIYFLKGSDDNSSIIDFIKSYNAIADYYQTNPIYIVDLEKCDTIYRAYVGSDTTYNIDGVSNIDDLYISQRKTLIYIDEVARYIAGTNKAIISYFEELTGLDFLE